MTNTINNTTMLAANSDARIILCADGNAIAFRLQQVDYATGDYVTAEMDERYFAGYYIPNAAKARKIANKISKIYHINAADTITYNIMHTAEGLVKELISWYTRYNAQYGDDAEYRIKIAVLDLQGDYRIAKDAAETIANCEIAEENNW